MKKENDLFNLVFTILFLIVLGIVDIIIIQYAWNNIFITIFPVEKINIWKTFGLYTIISYIIPTDYSDVSQSERIIRCIARMIVYGLLIFIAAVFI